MLGGNNECRGAWNVASGRKEARYRAWERARHGAQRGGGAQRAA